MEPTPPCKAAESDNMELDIEPGSPDLFSQLENQLDAQTNHDNYRIPTVEEIMGAEDYMDIDDSSPAPRHERSDKQPEQSRVLRALADTYVSKAGLPPRSRNHPLPYRPHRSVHTPKPNTGRVTKHGPLNRIQSPLFRPTSRASGQDRYGKTPSLPSVNDRQQLEIAMPPFCNQRTHLLPVREQLQDAFNVTIKLLKKDLTHNYKRIIIRPRPTDAEEGMSNDNALVRFFSMRAFVFFSSWAQEMAQVGEVISVMDFLRGYVRRETDDLVAAASRLIPGGGGAAAAAAAGPGPGPAMGVARGNMMPRPDKRRGYWHTGDGRGE
ncbi:hypothetical protein GGR53DRAFT_469491 [Hypoxylon sp. FL1150]|nr:hypothetical protein GGR53DRAFT_469491 [Hypoxylon sp. FL1150]